MIRGAVPSRSLPLGGWPLGGLPGGEEPPTPLPDGRELGVWLVGPSGAAWPVDYLDMRVRGGRYVDGDGALTIPASSPLVGLYMGSTVGEEFRAVTLRVFYRDATTPLWSGMMGGSRMVAKGDSGEVEILFEQSGGHALRRRLLTKTSQASAIYTIGTTAADNIALSIMRECIGPTPTEPTGYPAGADRDDFAELTFEVAAAHSPGLSSSQPELQEQSGVNLLDLVPEFLEQEDLALVVTDNQDQTHDIDVDYPFEEEDVSASVVFSSWLGNLTDFEAAVDTKSLVNVWSVEGNTSQIYTENAPSHGSWGVYEGHAQKPQGSNNLADVAGASVWLPARYGTGTVTYKASIIERDGCKFNQDWGPRSKIRIAEAVYGYDFDQVCVEWELAAQNGGPAELSYTFGQPAMNQDTHVAGFTGTVGTRFGGGRWRNKRN